MKRRSELSPEALHRVRETARLYRERPGVREKRIAACRDWGERNHDRTLSLHASRRARVKADAFEHYGRECYCCGEGDPMFLGLDHIDGKGAEHRREIGMQAALWAYRNDWPPIFRTACHNCNQAAHANGGTCPHNRAANERAERLLVESLTPEQRVSYRAHRLFYVRTASAVYRVERRAGDNVKLLNGRGRIAGSYCARPARVPVECAMLAQKLWLETDEEAFKKVANFRATG
jgi:hypothetical protein